MQERPLLRKPVVRLFPGSSSVHDTGKTNRIFSVLNRGLVVKRKKSEHHFSKHNFTEAVIIR